MESAVSASLKEHAKKQLERDTGPLIIDALHELQAVDPMCNADGQAGVGAALQYPAIDKSEQCRDLPAPLRPSGRGLLTSFILAICSLLLLDSPLTHAKDFAMQDRQGHYQPYTPGMKRPDGVFPPMEGYTHQDLIYAAAVRVEAFLKVQDVDPTLIRESLFALAAHLKTKFEEEGVEYQISSWYQKPYDDPAGRTRSVERMGEHFGGSAVDAAADSLRGSPLLLKGREFYGEFIGAAGDGVHDLIVTLNKPSS